MRKFDILILFFLTLILSGVAAGAETIELGDNQNAFNSNWATTNYTATGEIKTAQSLIGHASYALVNRDVTDSNVFQYDAVFNLYDLSGIDGGVFLGVGINGSTVSVPSLRGIGIASNNTDKFSVYDGASFHELNVPTTVGSYHVQ